MSPSSGAMRQKVAHTTTSPGVYLMKDDGGNILYVGKARNLKKRLATYFLKSGHTDPKTNVLLRRVADFDTIVTATEHEALILESTLIKRHRPRYNVVLKDDKRYPVLRLDTTAAYPHLSVVRNITKDGAVYFGPFSSASAVHRTLNVINKTFKLRKCKGVLKPRSRPCLHYQMNRCLAPCCRDVSPDAYQDTVREVVLFLSGKMPVLIEKIRGQMQAAVQVQEFESAAMLRDKMFALEKILEKQVVVGTDALDRDVVGIARSAHLIVITQLYVRGGYLVGTRHHEVAETIATDRELLSSFIEQYYDITPFLPDELLVPFRLDDAALVEARLTERRGRKVHIHCPQRGNKTALTAMAEENARNRLDARLKELLSNERLLVRLQKHLRLAALPERIECFDNSNLQGSQMVAGMVVFEKGRPRKAAYRTFVLRQVTKPDDYAAMNEVLTRRFRPPQGPIDPMPQLLMLDGGRGQLNIALSVLENLGFAAQVPVLAIAKKNPGKGEQQDKVFLPGRANPVVFGKETDLLLFLQSIRDEAHRFAVGFHRNRRQKETVRSVLDDIPGVGKQRRREMLRHFGGIDGLRAASVQDIAALPGFPRKLAQHVVAALHEGDEGGGQGASSEKFTS